MLYVSPNELLTRDQLRRIPIVQAPGIRSSRYAGIQHGYLADTVVEELGKQNFDIVDEKWKTSKNLANVYGCVDIQHKNAALPFQGTYSLGIRASNICEFAVTFAAGARVAICENGLCTGEYVMRRRHYTGLNLALAVHEAVCDYREQMLDVTKMAHFLMTSPITDMEASHLMMNLIRRDYVADRYLKYIDQEYHFPQHAEFKAPNKWSLYNAATEVFKRIPVDQQIAAMVGLRDVLTDGQWRK